MWVLTHQGAGIWNVDKMAVGETVTLKITVTVEQLGDITNTAQVSAADQDDTDSTPSNNVLEEDDQDEVTVTVTGLGIIGDFTWLDSDGDGVFGPGDSPLPGIAVTLTYPDGTTETQTTDADGEYLYEDLEAGEYVATVGAGPEGTTLTTASEFEINLGDGDAFLNADFGFQPAPPLGSIGDFVWLDLDGDGLFSPGESPLSGVSLTLTKPDGTTASTATNAIGEYLFEDLPDGEYSVQVGNGPAGMTLTTPNKFDIDLGVGEDYLLADFGFEPAPELGTIGDFVWLDLDGDGIYGPGEPGLSGVTITLTFPDGTDVTSVTNNDGEYLFIGLPAGDYTATVGNGPFGSTLTTPESFDISLGAGEDYLLADFGFEPSPEKGIIGDFVWLDLNNDGLHSPGEPGIPGVAVTLTLPGGAATIGTTTNNDGEYLFTDLPPGDYVVTVGDGPVGSTLTTPESYDVALDAGEAFLDADFGFAPSPELGTIGDFVWLDLDGNGLFGPGEPGLSGVSVTLTYPDGSTATTQTNNDGEYLFTGLEPGDYVATVGNGPTGSVLTTPESFNVDLGAGENFLTADFGFEPDAALGTIGDFVWLDIDGDGIQDAGEPGINGVNVTLTYPDGSTATETTGTNGFYIFLDLPAGNYTVEVGDGPAGTLLTTTDSYSTALSVGEDYLVADFGFEPAQNWVLLETLFGWTWTATDCKAQANLVLQA